MGDRLRIAILSPVWFSVPPTGYGGIEWIVSLLADGLVDAGHDVMIDLPAGYMFLDAEQAKRFMEKMKRAPTFSAWAPSRASRHPPPRQDLPQPRARRSSVSTCAWMSSWPVAARTPMASPA